MSYNNTILIVLNKCHSLSHNLFTCPFTFNNKLIKTPSIKASVCSSKKIIKNLFYSTNKNQQINNRKFKSIHKSVTFLVSLYCSTITNQQFIIMGCDKKIKKWRILRWLISMCEKSQSFVFFVQRANGMWNWKTILFSVWISGALTKIFNNTSCKDTTFVYGNWQHWSSWR